VNANYFRMAAALRRVHLVTWQPYMDECLEILDTHPDALPSDRNLKWWARLGHIMEDAGVRSSDDVGSVVTFADSRAWHEIKSFENRLSRWRAEVPHDVYTGESSPVGVGILLILLRADGSYRMCSEYLHSRICNELGL
jgi:hypothetical protein